MPQTPVIHPPPTGLIARYVGSSGGATTRYYWVQAIYPDGYSPLASVTVTTPASLDSNNRVGVTWNPAPGAIGYNVYYTTSSTIPSSGSIVVALGESSNAINDVGASNSPASGVVLSRGLKEAFARYDFATDGGAQGTINLALADTLPAGAVVCFGNWYCSVAATSAGSSTLAFGTSAGSSTTSILGATAKATHALNATGICACQTTPFRMSAAGQITGTIGTADMTAGTIEVHVFYYIPTKAA